MGLNRRGFISRALSAVSACLVPFSWLRGSRGATEHDPVRVVRNWKVAMEDGISVTLPDGWRVMSKAEIASLCPRRLDS